jgi:hypothetical protein
MRGLVWAGVLLLVFWLVLWLVLKIASVLIHLLVVAGIILLIWGLVKRGAKAIRAE